MPYMKVPNESRVFFARYGYYNGSKYKFTHRDPKTGELFGDDIPVGKNPVTFGKWVSGESVRLINEDDNGREVVEPDRKQKKKNRGKKHENN